ncbi:hypothetical protein J7K50_06445 [bacterium]|nr:hypothetical protein [bacterium]
MKKFFLSLLLGVMIFSSVFFTLGCPKPEDPSQEMQPAPVGGGGGTAGGDTTDNGNGGGDEDVLEELGD